jgi:hypothetical protein
MKALSRRAVFTGLIVAAATALFICAGAIAANPTSVSVSASVPSTIELTMPTTVVNFGGGSLAPGSTYTQGISASVNSNKAWTLKVTKNHDLRGTGATPEDIPSADLTFTSSTSDPKVTPVGTPTEFGTNTTVCSGARGNNLSSTITYSLTVPWDQAPDTYSATHVYTATQP